MAGASCGKQRNNSDNQILIFEREHMKTAKLFFLAAFVPAVALGDYAADKKKYDECVAIQRLAFRCLPTSLTGLKATSAKLADRRRWPRNPSKVVRLLSPKRKRHRPHRSCQTPSSGRVLPRYRACRTLGCLGAGDKPGPYLLRGKLAQGARIPPHTHPEERNGTVLSGTVYVGFSPTFDESKAMAIPAGGVWVAPANVPHFLWAKDGEAVFQCGGIGPTATSFVKQ